MYYFCWRCQERHEGRCPRDRVAQRQATLAGVLFIVAMVVLFVALMLLATHAGAS